MTQFKVEQRKYDNCTSEKFRSAFGVDLCLSYNRPKLGAGLFDLLKPVNLDRVMASEYSDDYSDDDEDDEEADEDQNDEDEEIYGGLDRPRLSLAGPYHYQVIINSFGHLHLSQ